MKGVKEDYFGAYFRMKHILHDLKGAGEFDSEMGVDHSHNSILVLSNLEIDLEHNLEKLQEVLSTIDT